MVGLSPMVAAALAQHELGPEALRSYEVLGPDIYLYLKDKLVIRVEISSLPASVVDDAELPEATQRAAPEPQRARKGAAGRGSPSKTARKRSTRSRSSSGARPKSSRNRPSAG